MNNDPNTNQPVFCEICNYNEVDTKMTLKRDVQGKLLKEPTEVHVCEKCAEWLSNRS